MAVASSKVDKSSGREYDVGIEGGRLSSAGIVIGVSARGCDDRRVAVALLPLAVVDAELAVLLLVDGPELESCVLASKSFFFLQLRMTVGLMTGSGSRG